MAKFHFAFLPVKLRPAYWLAIRKKDINDTPLHVQRMMMPQQRDSYELLYKFDKLLLLLQSSTASPSEGACTREQSPPAILIWWWSPVLSVQCRGRTVSEKKVIRLLQAVIGMPSATDSLPVVNGMLLKANKITIPALRNLHLTDVTHNTQSDPWAHCKRSPVHFSHYFSYLRRDIPAWDSGHKYQTTVCQCLHSLLENMTSNM